MSRSVRDQRPDYEALRAAQARAQEADRISRDLSFAGQYNGYSPMAAFQDALGDYYDAGMIGEPPRLEQFRNWTDELEKA